MKRGKLSKPDEAKLKKGECPECGSKKFFQGLKGGLVIFCENGHRFWCEAGNLEYQGQEKVHSIHKDQEMELLVLDQRGTTGCQKLG